MALKIAVYNVKGGAGKTLVAANLAVAYAQQGKRVLAVDLDQQGSLGTSFGLNPEELEVGTSDLLEGAPLADCTTDGPENITLVVGDRALADFEIQMTQMRYREQLLQRQLAGAEDLYDIVIVDCPPSAGLLSMAAVIYSDGLVVPVNMRQVGTIYALSDLAAFLSELAEVGVVRPVLGIVRTEARPREDIHATCTSLLEDCPWTRLGPEIPATTQVSKSEAFGVPIAAWKPDSLPGASFRSIASDLTESAGKLTKTAGKAGKKRLVAA